MPLFTYQIKKKGGAPEYIEIEQSLSEDPLEVHPLTGEPIMRVPQSPSLTLKHSSTREKTVLSPDHLKKHGFSVLEKDQSTQNYVQTVGKKIKADPLND